MTAKQKLAAYRVLSVLQALGEASAREINEACAEAGYGLYQKKVWYLLHTLEKEGYIERVGYKEGYIERVGYKEGYIERVGYKEGYIERVGYKGASIWRDTGKSWVALAPDDTHWSLIILGQMAANLHRGL